MIPAIKSGAAPDVEHIPDTLQFATTASKNENVYTLHAWGIDHLVQLSMPPLVVLGGTLTLNRLHQISGAQELKKTVIPNNLGTPTRVQASP